MIYITYNIYFYIYIYFIYIYIYICIYIYIYEVYTLKQVKHSSKNEFREKQQ